MVVLKGSRLIDATGADVIEDAVVVIGDDGRIQQVGAAREVPVPPGAEVLDLRGCTLMPGLMDCHMHPMGFNGLTFHNARVAAFEITPQLQMLYALLHVQMCFEMGFTTLRDLGWMSYAGLLTSESVAVRDAIDNGIFAGPRLRVAGWTVITGSHLDLVFPRAAIRQPGTTADGPWELRKLARENLRKGADWIKTCVSGGGGTDKEEPDVQNMTQEELNAVVEEAHFFHKRAAVHAFTPNAQRMAIAAGADTIEHCVFTDDDALERLVGEQKIIVPTLAHRTDRAIQLRAETGTAEFVTRKMKTIQPITEATFKRMHQAGVKMAMGTDTQIDPEMAANAMELEIYVRFGMSPMEAIQTATRNAAEAIGVDDITGTLVPGKYADIIAIDGNPLDDIRLVTQRDHIKMVMKEGTVYVDRRPGSEKYLISNQRWDWRRL